MNSRTSCLRWVGALVVSSVSLAGCSGPTNDPEEAPAQTSQDRLHTIYEVKSEGRLLGYLEKRHVVDGPSVIDLDPRFYYYILDRDFNRVGHMTDLGATYRFRAHGDQELVSNFTTEKNLTLFFDVEGPIELVPAEPRSN
jgi:hypothetical protein